MGVDSRINEEEIKNLIINVLKAKNIYSTSVNVPMFAKTAISIINRMSVGVAFNANATICASRQEISNKFGEAIVQVVERWLPDCCIVTKESNIYDRRYWKEQYRAYKIILVKDCEVPYIEKLEKALSDIEKEGWIPIVILCVDESVFERLHRYGNNDSRLFYSLCGFKIVIPDMNSQNVTDAVFVKLIDKGFVLKDGFITRLRIYISKVYPKTVFTQNEFVDNLVETIYQSHYRKIDPGLLLDESDVPFTLNRRKSDRVSSKDGGERGEAGNGEDVTELIKNSRNEGRLESLVSLVNDGDITLAKAASKMNLSVEDFCQTAERYGFVLL